MDPALFCTQTRLLIVAGKGGVGKTTVTAALARLAARCELETLIVEVDGKSGLPVMFGQAGTLGYEDRVLARGGGPDGSADIRARTITPERALVEYLHDHGMGLLAEKLANSGVTDVATAAVPGIKDILLLGKVKQLEQAKAADVILLDAPAAGHAVSTLMAPQGLLDAAQGGPIRKQAEDVAALLGDGRRCQVLLVTLPEETPVNELIETGYALEDRIGVALAPVVVNNVIPVLNTEHLRTDPKVAAARAGMQLTDEQLDALAGAAQFRLIRQATQAEQLAKMADTLPLPQLHLPHLLAGEIGLEALDVLADALAHAIERLPDPPQKDIDSSAKPASGPASACNQGGIRA